MVRKAALILGLVAAPLAAQDLSSPWLDWVKQNAPHGFDITPDGTIWLNLTEPGRTDDYAINAEDLKAAREADHSQMQYFWVRGYHKRNPKARYRESKMRYGVNCSTKQIMTTTEAYYSATGDLISRSSSIYPQDVIPGTYSAEYYRLICLIN